MMFTDSFLPGMENNMKTGLVLEGGASRTIFTCGILDALLENDIYINYVAGASAGISYGVSYLSKQHGVHERQALYGRAKYVQKEQSFVLRSGFCV